MKRYSKPAAGILIVLFCILMGCEKKEEAAGVMSVRFEDSADAGAEDAGISQEGNSADGAGEKEAGTSSGEELTPTVCVVHICGAVVNPGVYTLEEDSRIYQAVEAAGGFRGDAREDYLNQADRIADGMKIYVPTCEETEGTAWEAMTEGSGMEDVSGLVNINTADEERLCTLPGVGSAKAKSIIAYREKNGSYQKIEDIMNVEGIKEGLFQKIRDSITV